MLEKREYFSTGESILWILKASKQGGAADQIEEDVYRL